MQERRAEEYIKLLSEISFRFKLVAGFYLLYLISPIFALIMLEEALNSFSQAVINGELQVASSLVPVVLENYAMYTLVYAFSSLLLSVSLLLVSKKTRQLGHILNSKGLEWIYYFFIMLFLLATLIAIYLITTLPQILKILEDHLTRALQTKNLEEIRLEIPYLSELSSIQESFLVFIVIAYGAIVRSLIEEYELLEYMKNGANLLLIGGLIEIIERLLGGIGIGPIIILVGFLLLTRKRKIK